MITKSSFDFLKGLKKNNNKEWFEKNRKSYEATKKELLDFSQEIINGISLWEKEMKNIDPKKTMFRINRDIRFSADKSPYKTNLGAWFNSQGKDALSAGYYFHLQPGNCFVAGGIYMPDPVIIKAIRQEIDYNLKGFEKILNDKEFKKTFGTMEGEKLKTAPKDYPKDHPAIEYLKYKTFTVWHKLTDEEVLDKKFISKALSIYKLMNPFNTFLNEAVGVGKEK